MATLNVFSDRDLSRDITTVDELRAMLPAVPHIPSAYCLDLDGRSIQVWYGNPDQDHHLIKTFHGHAVDRQSFETVTQATDAFLKLARLALSQEL